MVAWYTKIHSADFIGFAPFLRCDNCKNSNNFEIFQNYLQYKPYSIIPTPKIYAWFFVRCPVCHNGFTLKKNSENHKVLDLLEGGRERTQQYFRSVNEKEQNVILKGLNRNKFSKLSMLLSFS